MADALDVIEAGIIPAYAGSTTAQTGKDAGKRDHPRIRGEHFLPTFKRILPAGSSPHTRGALKPVGGHVDVAGIIPAYAGSTQDPTEPSQENMDHPRIRGEHYSHECELPDSHGSSPHTRGAHVGGSERVEVEGIIPAYAGSTRPVKMAPELRTDHPRIRGEHASRRLDVHVRERIIPAYAGSTRAPHGPVRPAGDHPRIRGEHDCSIYFTNFPTGSSPHTRGALSSGAEASSGSGIIPAYAGSTLGNPCNTKDRRRDYTSFPLPVTHPSGGGGS